MNLKILKNKNFSLVVFGELISMLGSNLQSFALSLYVLKLTGSAAKFASVLALSLIPELILAPFAGVLVDRLNRKKIIVLINILNSIVVLCLSSILFRFGKIPLVYIYITSLVLAFNNVIFSPAIRTIIPSVVDKENLLSANSLSAFVQGVAEISGPLLAGIILGCFGMFIILILNSISFIIAAIFESFITLPNDKSENEAINFSSFFSDFAEGFKFIKKEKFILALSISAFIINFAMPTISNVGFTFISKNILKVSDASYGLMSSIAGLGMILGPVTAGFIAKKIKLVTLFNGGILCVAMMLVIMAASITPACTSLFKTNIVSAIIITLIVLLIIAVIMIINISLSTMFQNIVPNNLLGRVGSVLSVISCAAHPIGQITFGALFDLIPGYYVLIIATCVLMLSVLVFKMLVKKNNSYYTKI